MNDRSKLPVLVAFAAPLLVFLPALENGFLLWDDRVLLVENPHFRGLGAAQITWAFTTLHAGPYQPLAWLTYGLDYVLSGGMDPRAFHFTNVLLHAVASALLASSLLRLLPRLVPSLKDAAVVTAWAAALGALFWSCHPLRVESVAWVAQRRDVLSCVFLFASLRAWAGHLDESPDGAEWGRSRSYWGALFLYGASLLAKATAMGWCAVLLLLDVALRRRGEGRLLVAEKVPFLVAAAPLALVAWMGQESSGAVREVVELGVVDRLVVAGYAAAFYPFHTLLPLGLRAHYARGFPFDPWQAHLLAGFAASLAACVAAFVLRRRATGWACAWAAFLVLLAPVSGITAIGSHLVADRFASQSTVPLVVAATASLAAWIVARPGPRARAAAIGAGVLLLGLAAGTHVLSKTWRSTATLFDRVLEFEPDNWRAHMVAGLAAVREERLADGRAHFERALELHAPAASAANAQLSWIAYRSGDRVAAESLALAALVDDAFEFTALRTAALVADDAGHLEACEDWLRRADAVKPGHSRVLSHLAWVRFRRGDAAEARALVIRALEADTTHAGGWRLLGMVQEKAGDLDGAEAAYRRALELDPSVMEALGKLAMLVGRRDVAEAERLLREGLAIDPTHPETRGVLGGLLESKGRREEALALYLDGVAVVPQEAIFHGNAARLLAGDGRFDEALPHAERAVELLPGGTGPRLQLADLYLRLERRDDAVRLATDVADDAKARGDGAAEQRARRFLERARSPAAGTDTGPGAPSGE